jgi:hypothetical protein
MGRDPVSEPSPAKQNQINPSKILGFAVLWRRRHKRSSRAGAISRGGQRDVGASPVFAAALGALAVLIFHSGFSPTEITYSSGANVIGTDDGRIIILDLSPHATPPTGTCAFLRADTKRSLLASCSVTTDEGRTTEMPTDPLGKVAVTRCTARVSFPIIPSLSNIKYKESAYEVGSLPPYDTIHTTNFFPDNSFSRTLASSREMKRGDIFASSFVLARRSASAFSLASAARAVASATIARDDSASADSRAVCVFSSAILPRAAAVSFLASAIRTSASCCAIAASWYPTQPDTKERGRRYSATNERNDRCPAEYRVPKR